jgi:hypothetical protein
MSTRASNSIVRAVRRRVERKPGAALLAHTVRRVPVPGTQFRATVFIYQLNGDQHFVAELTEPDLPHVYNTTKLANESASEIGRALGYCMTLLRHTVTNDPRFGRKIIPMALNGHGGRH